MILNTTRIAATALAIGLGLAATSGQAEDQHSMSVTGSNPKTIVVASNGVAYTQLQTKGTVRFSGLYEYDAGSNGRIKAWEVWPVIQYAVGNSQWYGDYQTYPKGSRPKTVHKKVDMDVPAQFLNDAAVKVCNLRATALRQGGHSNAHIFGTDRTEKLDVRMNHKIQLTGLKSKVLTEAGGIYQLAVRCARFSGPALPQLGSVQKPKPATPGVQAPSAAKPTSGPETRAPRMLLKIGN